MLTYFSAITSIFDLDAENNKRPQCIALGRGTTARSLELSLLAINVL